MVDFDLIEQKVRNNQLSEAVEDYVKLINDENEPRLPFIMKSLYSVLNHGVGLNIEQINIIKPYIDSFDEDIQENAIDVYLKGLSNNPDLLLIEIDFILTKLNEFEPVIRTKILEFFITLFPWKFNLDLQNKIMVAIYNRTEDTHWEIRLKVIEFFEKLIQENPDLLLPFKDNVKNLLAEPDLDVSREIMDFLYHYILKTYTKQDMTELFNTIYNKDWIIQEKILRIVSKIGSYDQNLILDILEGLIKLLDYNDVYLQREASLTIESLMNLYPELFDEILFSYYLQEKIENLNEIEVLLAKSVIEHEYPRFQQIYMRFTPVIQSSINLIVNILKYINNISPKIAENIFAALLDDFFKIISHEETYKLKALLEKIPHFNLYSICYEKLFKKEPFKEKEKELDRLDLISLLLSKIPELSYVEMKNWLKQQLEVKDVELNMICEKFNIKHDQVIEILQNLNKKGLFEGLIYDDKIHKTSIDKILEYKPDLFFYKKWDINPQPNNQYNIKLMINIKNITETSLKNINLILNYPEHILKIIGNEYSNIFSFKELATNSSETIIWTFRKNDNKIQEPQQSTVNLNIFYLKNQRLFNMVKKLDILIL